MPKIIKQIQLNLHGQQVLPSAETLYRSNDIENKIAASLDI